MITPEMKELLVHYNEGLKKYKKALFSEALEHFERARSIVPEDGPTDVYINRCKEYIVNPPSGKWDGVSTMKNK